MAKKLTAVLLALLLAASSFIYSAAEESADVSDGSAITESTDASQTVSSEQESNAETSSEEESQEESHEESQESEAYKVTSFEELCDAILDSCENIVLNESITFPSAIALPSGAKITLSGSGSIENASFAGSGSIAISGVSVSSLTVGDSAAVELDGSTGALSASGDCTVKITGDVTGLEDTVGAAVSDTAVVTVEGSVTGGSGTSGDGGDGIYAAGSGKIIISGSVTGGASGSSGRAGCGIGFSNSSKNSVEIGGSVTGGEGTSDIGGTGIAFSDSDAGATVRGTLSGGAGKSGGAGAEIKNGASLIVNGTISGGSGTSGDGGDGVIITKGTLKCADIVGGDGENGGCGLDIRASAASDVRIRASAVSGGKGTAAGGDGVCFSCVPGSTVNLTGAVTGGEGDAKHGADYRDETGEDQTVTITVSDYDGRRVYLSGTFSFELYGLPVSGKFDSTYISIARNEDELFGNYDLEGYFLYGQYNVTSDSGASVTFSEPDRSGKECLILYHDGKAASTLYEGTFGGEYTVESPSDGVYALYIKEEEFSIVIGCGKNGSVSPDGMVYVREGDSLTLTVRPNSGYETDKVRIGGKNVTMSGTQYTFTNIRESTTFYVTFKKITVTSDMHTVTIRASSGGSVLPSSSAKVHDGGSLTLTMTPNDGYYLKRITVDGESVRFSGNQYTLENVTADRVVAVTFTALTKYSVIAQCGDGGTVTPESALVSSGGSAKFVVTPEAGYEISRVSVNGGELSNSGRVYTVSKVKRDVTFTVVFKRDDTWAYNCLIASDVSWNTSPLTLELLDYTVISAEVLEKIASEYSSSKVYAVAADYSYVFEPGAFAGLGSENLDFSLTVTASAHDSFADGSENYGVVYASSALPESSVTLSLGAGNAGAEYEAYIFASDTYTSIGKYICDPGGKLTLPYTGAQTVLVKTCGEPVAFNVKIQGRGSTDPSGTKMVTSGGSLTVSFIPDDGYDVGAVLFNGSEIEYDKSGSMTFSDITEEATLTVVFELAGGAGRAAYVGNTAMIVLIVFGSTMILCACAYLIMRRKGLIKYKKEL